MRPKLKCVTVITHISNTYYELIQVSQMRIKYLSKSVMRDIYLLPVP